MTGLLMKVLPPVAAATLIGAGALMVDTKVTASQVQVKVDMLDDSVKDLKQEVHKLRDDIGRIEERFGRIEDRFGRIEALLSARPPSRGWWR